MGTHPTTPSCYGDKGQLLFWPSRGSLGPLFPLPLGNGYLRCYPGVVLAEKKIAWTINGLDHSAPLLCYQASSHARPLTPPPSSWPSDVTPQPRVCGAVAHAMKRAACSVFLGAVRGDGLAVNGPPEWHRSVVLYHCADDDRMDF